MKLLRSPLSLVRGLGSAKDGYEHWWMQRVTAVAMVPLVAWLLIGLIGLSGASHAEVVQWVGHPFNSGMMVLFLLAMFYHAALGLQVVIEDYVHDEPVKLASLLGMKFVLALLAVIAVVAVLRITLFAVMSEFGG